MQASGDAFPPAAKVAAPAEEIKGNRTACPAGKRKRGDIRRPVSPIDRYHFFLKIKTFLSSVKGSARKGFASTSTLGNTPIVRAIS